ncbi:MAG: hypothetical protein AB7H90_07225 [Alphaproteobacteria bacterium]
MRTKTGTFQQFKERTLAIARGKRHPDPHEPRIWVEQPLRRLQDYSTDDLEDARRRIEETEEWISQTSERRPGAGWDHVKERLRCDREAVEAELNRRGHSA